MPENSGSDSHKCGHDLKSIDLIEPNLILRVKETGVSLERDRRLKL